MNPHIWLNWDRNVLQQLITPMKGTVRISKSPHPPDQLNGQVRMFTQSMFFKGWQRTSEVCTSGPIHTYQEELRMYVCMYGYGMVAPAVQGSRVSLSRLLLLSPPAPHTFDPSS